MERVLVVGAGGVGRAVAAALVERGFGVRLVSRSGTAQAAEGVEAVRADAADAAALTSLAHGARTVVNAANPAYTAWERDWPPMARAVLTAAERTGADLVVVGNLYAYGPVTGPLREDHPVRPTGSKGRVRDRMWQEALAAHRAGRVRATELRASDYFGPGARTGVSLLNDHVLRPAARGRRVRLLDGDPHAPHSWTYLPDIAELAAAVVAAGADGPAWGRPWHVPTAPARSVAELATAAAADRGIPRITVLPPPARAALRLVPVVRELRETEHQRAAAFVLDSTAAQEAFELRPTPWDRSLPATLSALR